MLCNEDSWLHSCLLKYIVILSSLFSLLACLCMQLSTLYVQFGQNTFKLPKRSKLICRFHMILLLTQLMWKLSKTEYLETCGSLIQHIQHGTAKIWFKHVATNTVQTTSRKAKTMRRAAQTVAAVRAQKQMQHQAGRRLRPFRAWVSGYKAFAKTWIP